MFSKLGIFVSRHWLAIICAWFVAAVCLQVVGPRWGDVTRDGDLAYLPSDRPSVRGEALLAEAFPHNRARSQFVLVVSRDEGKLTPEDLQVADRLARPFHNLRGAALIRKVQESINSLNESARGDQQEEAVQVPESAVEDLQLALDHLDLAILGDESFAPGFHNRAIANELLGKSTESEADARHAAQLDERFRDMANQPYPANSDDIPILDIWTRHTDVVNEMLASNDGKAQLIILQMATEFMATQNMELLEWVQTRIEDAKRELGAERLRGLTIGISGSAAVGGDMLTSASESIRNTEIYTVVLVVVILALVYRSPLLVAVPLLTIVVSLLVSMSIVASLTQLHLLPGMQWWNFMVFKTTRIFVVVILFGAGTDFCLFLISRYREELGSGVSNADAIARALSGVADALVASSFTTIVGLAMMFFADFGKYRNSGPAIGLCLLVTLIACLTLAPALLRAFGNVVFWPLGIGRLRTESNRHYQSAGRKLASRNDEPTPFFWNRIASLIIAYPGRILVASVFLLSPLAWYGSALEPLSLSRTDRANRANTSATRDDALQIPPASWYQLRVGRELVTYNLLAELNDNRPSKRGTEILKRHFPIGESGPLIIIAKKANGDFDTKEGGNAILDLTEKLFIDGVLKVRSVRNPMGGAIKRVSVFDMARRVHRITKAIFLTDVPELKGDVARFELVLDDPPFSLDAIQVLKNVDSMLTELSQDPDSYWAGTEFAYAGTTAAINDLREVTRSDNIRIKVLVVLAVLSILLVILRRPIICLYLILSVLFSYYVTMGITELFFSYLYGENFAGLDWKVPLFLFVILVAIGQDYNIYLTTRVFEEQGIHGPIHGLRRAVVCTGGIITSCGVIMAGTFISMTTGSLRGMIELGFALSLGVLLDTFVVRPVLVPAFLALLARCDASQWRSLVPK